MLETKNTPTQVILNHSKLKNDKEQNIQDLIRKLTSARDIEAYSFPPPKEITNLQTKKIINEAYDDLQAAYKGPLKATDYKSAFLTMARAFVSCLHLTERLESEKNALLEGLKLESEEE